MKILYISQYFPPEMGAPAARVSELCRHWSDAGHEVTVLTGFPNHPTGVVHPDYAGKIWRLVCNEQADGLRVVRTWLLPLPNRKPHERILNYSSFHVSSCLTGTFLSRPDVIIATSPQLLVGMTGWWLSRVRDIPFVLEIRDIWPDTITASGVGNERSMLARTLTAISAFLYQKCHQLVVVTPAFRKEIIERYGIPTGKISVVENGVETDLFHPDGEGDSVKAKLGLQNKFVVSYIGTHGLAHGLRTMIQTAAQLQSEYPDILFLLVGEGADKESLKGMIEEMGLSNVRLVPQQPRERVPSFITASDICLVLLKKAPVFKTVIPTKMLEFMSCGRPVILGVDGQARNVMEKAQAGLYVEPENPEALSAAIVGLYRNAQLCERLGHNGRRYIVENLSRKHTAEVYLEVLKNMALESKG